MKMKREEYGENYQTHLLEQYKLYVEMSDRISSRRGQINSFYISLLSGLLATLSILGDKQAAFNSQGQMMLLLISLVGLILCTVWLFNIRALKRLNSAKFKVIHEVESFLPFACYDREWEIIQQSKSRQYLQQTQLEQLIPLILALPYFGLFCYALNSILK
jgi:hypothetical protein